MASFFVGITLPEDFTQEVEIWRRRFFAPKTAPHITLIPPFDWPASHDDLARSIGDSLKGLTPFPVTIKGLGRFGSAVIFINVAPSPGILRLHEKIQTGLAGAGIENRAKGRAYHPHITLATRLSVGQFNQYMEELVDYLPESEFICHQVALFRLETQARIRRWQVWRQLPLSQVSH